MADDVLVPVHCEKCGAKEWDIELATGSGALSAVCRDCDAIKPIYTDDDLADAEAEGVRWAEQFARDVAAVLGEVDHPDGKGWAEVLHWYANRIRGGQLSVRVDEVLRTTFDLPDDYLARQKQGDGRG